MRARLFSVLTTWKSFALVPHFTGGVKTRLRSVDEELYDGILFADPESKFAQQD
jgi:porphobilinogen deaminase